MAGTGLGHAASLSNTGPQGVDTSVVREAQAPMRVALSRDLNDRASTSSGDTDAVTLSLPPRTVTGDSDALDGYSGLLLKRGSNPFGDGAHKYSPSVVVGW